MKSRPIKSRPIKCDWPGYRCEKNAKHFYKSVQDDPRPWSRKYAARCGDHRPQLSRKKGLPIALYTRITRALFIVLVVMES